MLTVALLGGPLTGKRTLARQLREALDARGIAGVVIADATALMAAAHNELRFNDRGLWPEALAAQRRIGLTLLMGLDLPWEPGGRFSDSPAVREATDTLLRRELQGAGIGFQTVYGHGARRLQAALRAVGAALGRELLPDDPLLRDGSGRWACEACSDPDCEHRLFSALLARRGGG
ncbi:ATPase [Hydrogenophaga borbori]|uniref:ATPase n=1 Tax=Hydrogenophaga borbori TaxID=2294117 RepID=A0A372ENZ3_9BURK|nr:ATPase [Hydrogenophaga borbori]RFP82305.1 ATPase [Hydrogenophaga borbori]